MLDHLDSFGQVRALVFGQYAEASDDVHELLEIAARRLADQRWRSLGARTAQEAYGIYLSRFRRSMSMLVAREMARHRLRRVPFIGVSRTALRQRQQELSDEHQQRQRAPMRLHGLAGFAALQQFGGGAGRGVGGG